MQCKVHPFEHTDREYSKESLDLLSPLSELLLLDRAYGKVRDMRKRTELEVRNINLRRQIRALRKMQDIFITQSSCAYLECRKDCLFGPEMCGKLNHLPDEYAPYMANIQLDSILMEGEINVGMPKAS